MTSSRNRFAALAGFKGLWAIGLLLLLVPALLAAGPAPAPAPVGIGSSTGPIIAGPGLGTPLAGRAVPTQNYYSHFSLLYEGDYRDALEGFRNDLSSAVKTSQSRWIDSICYYTMVGESYYHLGQLKEALENYNAACQLYLAFADWTVQVQFPTTIQSAPNFPNIPWGQTARNMKLARLPSTMLMAQGNLYIDQQLAQGGIISPPQLFPVGVIEIHRCTALALRRRAELMGPVCPHDRLTDQLKTTFARHPGPHNSVIDAMVDAELGMACVGTGETGQAIALLKRSLSFAGEYDHPLTAMCLLELGHLYLDSGDYSSASNAFEEASYSAVAYGDWTTLEEAFRFAEQAHLMASRKGVFAPLLKAIPWAKTRGRELYASLLLSYAENNALLGQHVAAANGLSEAKATIGRRDMGIREIGSRLNYLTALLLYQKGNVPQGDEALNASLNYQKTGSKWLFQIALADYFVAGQSGPHLGAHRALSLYDIVLRDPNSADWAGKPLESLAVLSTPHPLVYEHWFEATLQSGVELSLEVADRARRHRFLSTLHLGGRLLALRWILEAPDDALDPHTLLQRQDLLARYPKYGDYAKQVRQLRDDLAAAPLVADGKDALRKQSDMLAEIGRISGLQEQILREMAVRREASDLAFPPLRKTKDVQATLPNRSLMLIFFSTSHNTYACLMSKERYKLWKIDSPPTLEKRVVAMLRGLGNFDANREVAQSQLMDEAWRHSARDATESLLAGSGVNLYQNIDELIIVPDGLMWYLPFEALQVGAKPQEKNPKDLVTLISRSRIRYVPTMSLAAPDTRQRKPLAEVGVVLGKLHLHDDPAGVQAVFDRLHKALPHSVAITGPLPAASPLYGSLFDGLVVFDDLAASEKGFYDWSPMPLDKTRGVGTLNQWFSLPWKSPTEIILPGFHTPAENALRQGSTGAVGSEMFLSVCGLMSTGARTVLISRWRTGGQTSYELMRQFVQELPYSTADDAWQRSVQTQIDTPLDLTREPRIKRANTSDQPTAKYPFFWAGYMLVDTGWSPAGAETAPPPVIKLKPGAAGAVAPRGPAPAGNLPGVAPPAGAPKGAGAQAAVPLGGAPGNKLLLKPARANN
jgi:tetratricopeptide (TPR) repeat protein